MALQGDIESFPVQDVLRLLQGQDQTGRLRVDGDRGALAIFMENGRLIAAEHDGDVGLSVLDAMVELVRSTSGSFAFDAGILPIMAAEAQSLESVLSEAEFCIAEWEEVEQSVTSRQMWVRPAQSFAADSITVNSDQWSILVAMGRGMALDDIARFAGVRPLHAAREAKALADMGAIELFESASAAGDEQEVPGSQPPVAVKAAGATSSGGNAITPNGNRKSNGNGKGTVSTDADVGARPASATPPSPAPARGALTSLASSLDRRLADVGPPPGLRERRKFSGSILDASDIGEAGPAQSGNPGADSMGDG